MRKFLLALLFVPLSAFAAEPIPLDLAPVNLQDYASIQRGARIFTNYCLTCHSANYMRYNRLEAVGLTAHQIEDNLMFAADNIGSRMTIAMRPADAKKWFGMAPPDLTVITRSRSPDWVYTYLRSFYRDDSRPTGWNNVLFSNVAMPNVLFGLQGQQVLKPAVAGQQPTLVLAAPGTLSPADYDATVGDLVNYLTWMGEPMKIKRMELGVFVLLFLSLLFILTYYLKKEFWKDVH